MATHSSVLAWRIPGTGEPGGLPSMGSHRGGHDWSDLAAAAADHLCVYSEKAMPLYGGKKHRFCLSLCNKDHVKRKMSSPAPPLSTCTLPASYVVRTDAQWRESLAVWWSRQDSWWRPIPQHGESSLTSHATDPETYTTESEIYRQLSMCQVLYYIPEHIWTKHGEVKCKFLPGKVILCQDTQQIPIFGYSDAKTRLSMLFACLRYLFKNKNPRNNPNCVISLPGERSFP